MPISGDNEYVSCQIIEHGFNAQIEGINLCGRTSKDAIGNPLLIDNYKGGKIDWDSFFKKKDEFRNIQRQGKIIPSCSGCLYLTKKQWDIEQYINTINIDNWVKCNANCIYCSRHEFKGTKEYNIYPIIKDLLEKNLLRNPADITIAGGEPTITRDFDKTLNILIKHNISTVRVMTNAIKYNKFIEKGLASGLINIMVSTDSGTADTYKKIKRVNKHKDVWKNLKRYAEKQKTDSLVKTKYILIPGINDNLEELSEYILRNAEAGIKYSSIDVEIFWLFDNIQNKDEIKKLYELYLKTQEYGIRLGVNISAFDRMSMVENKLK